MTQIIQNQTLPYREFQELLKKYVKNNILFEVIIKDNVISDLPQNRYWAENRMIKGRESEVKQLKIQMGILAKQFEAEELEDDNGELYLKIKGDRNAFRKHEELKEELGECFEFYFMDFLCERVTIMNNVFEGSKSLCLKKKN